MSNRGRAVLNSKRTSLPMLLALIALASGVACSEARPEPAHRADPVAAASSDTADSPASTATGAPSTALSASSRGVIGDSEGIRVPESSVAPGRMRMVTIVDDQDVHLRNGAQVLLSDALTVELFVDPFPPSTLSVWLDVYLTDAAGPVLDAEMSIDYDMLAMEHGPFSSEAENLGGGHYLFSLDYIMYGAWDQTVRIRVNDRSFRVPLLLVAYP